MTKIILNESYGGYDWSNHALVDYFERKGWTPEFRRFIGYKDESHWEEKYAPITKEQFLNQDNPDNETYLYGCEIAYEGSTFDAHFIGRKDPVAIALLEEKGSEYCSASHSFLTIKEVDEEKYGWDIDEYDGYESIVRTRLLTEEMIRNCKNVDEIIELLKEVNAFHYPNEF